MMAKAKTVVLKRNDTSACIRTSRRIARDVTATSAVLAATAMVNEKYKKSL